MLNLPSDPCTSLSPLSWAEATSVPGAQFVLLLLDAHSVLVLLKKSLPTSIMNISLLLIYQEPVLFACKIRDQLELISLGAAFISIFPQVKIQWTQYQLLKMLFFLLFCVTSGMKHPNPLFSVVFFY